jgi:hypothetical protein
LRAVLLIWLFTWLSWVAFVERFGNALPWADDYDFVMRGVATREQPVTWKYLWEPANEHRAPLTRLWLVGVGRLCNWNFRAILQVNVAVVALGALLLVFAVRRVRGRSSLADAFLPLLVMTSAHWETLGNYAYAYAMALGVWCGTAAFVVARWYLRSVAHLLLYILGALVVCWSGGPAGNLWALGFCAALVLGWFEATSRSWKFFALVGGVALLASSGLLLATVPPSPAAHLPFLSESWGMTLRAAARCSVGWIGYPVLQVLWPWALLVLAVPGLYLFTRFISEVWQQRSGGLLRWLDLAGLLLSVLLVAVAIGHGRAKYPGLWSSRYATMVLPIAAVLYLMLVRAGSPKTLTSFLAIGMAVCVGWNWQACIDSKRSLRPAQVQLTTALRTGAEPLSVLAEQYAEATGWCRQWGVQHLVGWWQRMRLAGISVFARDPHHACRSLLWYADSGALVAGLRAVTDPNCLNWRAVEAEAGGASAVYEVTVPRTGDYLLCLRWQVPSSGQHYTAQMDDGPLMRHPLPVLPGYRPCIPGPPVRLAAGTHRITITWPGPGSRLDVLELTLR